MKTSAKNLTEELIEMTKNHLKEAEKFLEMDESILNHKPDENSWSVLECMEHLNRYGEFYLPEIDQKMKESNHSTSNKFKSSWLGEYFAKSMLPKEKLNKMKTFTNMNPNNSKLGKQVLFKFIDQQNTLLDLLNVASSKNLSKIKTGISISKWIKLRLGDTFRVVIYHNKRHLSQASKLV